MSVKSTFLTANPFPKCNSELTKFVENLSANLESSSNGQIRRKPNWFLSEIAKSLPGQSESFNVNTLKALYSDSDALCVDEFNSELNSLDSSLKSSLESVCEDFLSDYSDCISVIYDVNENDADDGYYIYERKDAEGNLFKCPNCGKVEDFEDCDDCSIEPNGMEKEHIDSLLMAIHQVTNDFKVKMPNFLGSKASSVSVTETYIAVMQDIERPSAVKTLKVTVSNPKDNVFDIVKKKALSALSVDGYCPSDFEMVGCEKLSEMVAH